MLLRFALLGKAKCKIQISPHLHPTFARVGDQNPTVASIARLDGAPVSAPQPLRDPRMIQPGPPTQS